MTLHFAKSILRTTALGAAVMASGCSAGFGDEEAGPDYEEAISDVTAGATYTLRGVHSGRCLDVANGSSADGANVQLWDCNGLTAQQFRFESVGSGYFQIRNVASNKCLDVWGRSTADGAEI